MKPPNPIYVIHRDIDTRRREFVEKKYSAAELRFEYIPAVNGHDITELKPYKALLPSDFWGKDSIKPGAFGCFLSHRLAWKALCDSGEPYAIIAEDDSAPIKNFLQFWPKYHDQLGKCDILFLNNRIASWTDNAFANLNAVISGHQGVKRVLGSRYKAPGGDGYALTRKAAQELLLLSKKYRCICGVDWFLLGCCWDKRKVDVPNSLEFFYLRDRFANEDSQLKAKVCGRPLFKYNENMKSSIMHSKSVEISDLREKLFAG